MASDTEAQVDIPASDYQTLPKPGPRVEPMVKVAPTCMIWGMFIGLGLMVLTMLMWAVGNLGPILSKITSG